MAEICKTIAPQLRYFLCGYAYANALSERHSKLLFYHRALPYANAFSPLGLHFVHKVV
jgi:hypothetical protein